VVILVLTVLVVPKVVLDFLAQEDHKVNREIQYLQNRSSLVLLIMFVLLYYPM
jgi:hypothetical protein